MDSSPDIEPNTKSQRENIKKQRKKKKDYKDTKSNSNSEKSSVRAPRRLSLNIEKAQEVQQEFKPFEHRELFPIEIQKYMSDSRKSGAFLIQEAISNLRMPNSKLHPKDLEKMRLLALVQEKEIDNTLAKNSTANLSKSPMINLSENFSSMQNEFQQESYHNFPISLNSMELAGSNQINSNEKNYSARTNELISTNQPQNNEYLPYTNQMHQNEVNQSVGQATYNSKSDQHFLPDSDIEYINTQNNFLNQQVYSNDYAQQQFQYRRFVESNQNPPNSDFQYSQKQFEEMSEENFYASQKFQGDNLNDPSKMQEDNIPYNARPLQISENYQQQQSSNLTNFADHQLARINNLLAQKPRILHRFHTIDSASRTFGPFSQEASGINLSGSHENDSSINIPLNLSNPYPNIPISKGKIIDFSNFEDSIDTQNSIITHDTTTINIGGNSSNIASKNNRKNFLRMNTDPTKINKLVQTIDPTISLPKSVFHSKAPSSGGNNQRLSFSSQFSGTNEEYSSISSITDAPRNTNAIDFPTIELKISKNSQAMVQESDSIADSLAKNFPGPPKKKLQPYGRSNTDPKKLDQLATDIINSNIPFYNQASGSLTRLGHSTEEFDTSGGSEVNRSYVDILNEPMDKMTLKSDNSGKSVSFNFPKQLGSFQNNTNNFQPSVSNFSGLEKFDDSAKFQREPPLFENVAISMHPFANQTWQSNQNLGQSIDPGYAESDEFLNLQKNAKSNENNINYFDPNKFFP